MRRQKRSGENTAASPYLVVFEEEESLDKGEEEVHDVNKYEDGTLALCRVLCLKVRGDVESVQENTAAGERWNRGERQNKTLRYGVVM